MLRFLQNFNELSTFGMQIKMKYLLKTAAMFFLLYCFHPAHALIIKDSPFISYFDVPDRFVGAKGTADITSTDMTWYITVNNLASAKRSALIIHTYWCDDHGINCTVDTAESYRDTNILVKASECPEAIDINELLTCMLYKIKPGKYNFEVQGISSPNPSYRRPRVCLRMVQLDSVISGSWANSIQSCRMGNISNVWCAPVTPELIFDFGTMHVSEANNKYKEDELRVYCNGVANYKIISSTGSSLLSLSNGMSAKLQLNGNDLGETLTSINHADAETTYKMSVTLQGTPTSLGPFNATYLLLMDYP